MLGSSVTLVGVVAAHVASVVGAVAVDGDGRVVCVERASTGCNAYAASSVVLDLPSSCGVLVFFFFFFVVVVVVLFCFVLFCSTLACGLVWTFVFFRF
jgi:hypothetical protein